MVAEAIGAAKFCHDVGHHNIILEGDLLIVVKKIGVDMAKLEHNDSKVYCQVSLLDVIYKLKTK
jgi:hypothetical protein